MNLIGNKHVKDAGRTAGKVIQAIFRYVFLIAFSYVLIYPILFIIANAFKGSLDYFDPAVQWVPKTFTFYNLTLAFEALDFGKAFLRTLHYEMIAAALSVFSCSVAAYALARFEFRGKRILMGAMILSILVPTTMIIIPCYVSFRNVDILGILGLIGNVVGKDIRPNLIGTPLVFWIPSVLGVGLNGALFIYIFTQFFKGLPKELEEAAWIDGAGSWKTFFKIIIPSSGVVFVTVSVFAIVWNWNDYFLPQMYLTNEFPLAVNLSNLSATISSFLTSKAGEFAKVNIAQVFVSACLLYITPLLIFYGIIQKKFISSVVTSGIVG